MTRKKYIKKLMSCGMKRNAAERLARAAAASGVSYKEEWEWRCCVTTLTDLVAALAESDVRFNDWLIPLNGGA